MPSSKSPAASPPPEPPAGDDAVIAIVGPTASGKSAWALELAQRLDAEIVSADSRQLYRRLEIGSAKPTPADRALIPHHCLDLRDPAEPISLAEYLDAARAAIADIHRRGKLPLIVGGSGQYVWALLEGWIVPPAPPDHALRDQLARDAETRGAPALHHDLARVDPHAASRIPPNNLRRIIRALEVHRRTGRPISSWQRERRPLRFSAYAPAHSQEALDRRIDERAVAMFCAGFVEEVAALLREGLPEAAPGFNAIGYREVLAHLRGDLSLLDTVAAVARATQRFSRSQRRWFRAGDPRIRWSDAPPATHDIKIDLPANPPSPTLG